MRIRTWAGIGILAVALSTLPAPAQVSSFKATVPFPFVVGKQTLPAGTYVVQRFLGKPKTPKDPGVIVMKTSDHHVYKVIVTGSVADRKDSRADGSKLIFTSFRGKQYLNRVLVAGDGVAHQLANIPPEVETQRAEGEVIVTGLRYAADKEELQ